MINDSLDLESVRAHLRAANGKQFWRSLEELVGAPGFPEFLHREFPRQASLWDSSLSRRQFLQVMGAALALAGLTACATAPDEKIVPYVRQPEDVIPGEPLFFATAMPIGGYATGLLVESHEGRPTKVEGNPNHPASLGATDVFSQAAVLSLFDPDRSASASKNGQPSKWEDFRQELSAALDGQRENQGAGLRLLTGTVTSPTLARQLQLLLDAFPAAKWHQSEPINRDNIRAGSQLAFGQYIETRYAFDKADVILTLDADIFSSMPGHLRYTRDVTARRKVQDAPSAMNRIYAVESTPSLTGALADHRLALRAAEVDGFARVLAAKLGLVGFSSVPAPTASAHWLDALARDLEQHRGASIVIVGDGQPPIIHAIAHALNDVLGNVGRTVIYTDPIQANPVDQLTSLRDLVRDMEAGRVQVLVMLGGNPVYDAPVDLQFGEHLKQVALAIHLSLYEDETSAACRWHIPEAHFLESWSDSRAYDGTVSILQPLIAPLYGGKSAHELLDAFANQTPGSAHDIVKAYWQSQYGSPDFDLFWRTALHDGIIANTARPSKQVTLNMDWASIPPQTSNSESLEVIFRPEPNVYDGRFANNAWLQELPKPLTKLTWDNAALISPATAQQFGLSYEPNLKGGEHGAIVTDVVEVRYRGRTLRAPVWIMPGHPDHSLTLHLGCGRTRGGRVANGVGFNAYALRTSDALWFDSGAELRRTGERYELANTQQHWAMEGRDLVQFAQHLAPTPPSGSLYPARKFEGYQWGMAIDLNACVGCNACVIACQAENNIPVVGKDQVSKGREMHWLRIDRYYRGDLENPETFHQPVPCMHCENAPCELVCPVAATTHSSEGLNEMTYNRCVGTRYCSNNCPYKVRRFNFFQYADWDTPSLKPLHNPNVTVRSRGVMEKCTYCVQRINAARVAAEKEGRAIRDGEIVTACQAACPAEAIVFGNIADPNSRVSKLKSSSRNYALLAELNTRPRTTYLAVARNPNPEIG